LKKAFIEARGALMKRKIASVAILLFVLLMVKTHEFGQESKPPLTKDEILRLLKTESRGRLGQTNIVMEVAERGAFPVDGPTLEELRRAGARSLLLEEIQRSGENPRASQNDATSNESEQQGRTQDLGDRKIRELFNEVKGMMTRLLQQWQVLQSLPVESSPASAQMSPSAGVSLGNRTSERNIKLCLLDSLIQKNKEAIK
jgi:hypothetical protein